MSYVKGTLQSGEEIGLVAKLHWINYFGCALLALLAVAIWIYYITPGDYNKSDIFWLVVFFGGWSAYEFLKLWTREMAVTNKRVVLRKGIISIDSDEIKNPKIEGIEVEQSVMGRILNYGDVCFAGVGIGKLRFSNVAKPWQVKRRAEEIIGE